MKILVTGAAGFLGSKLVERLEADGEQVVWLDKRQTPFLSKRSGAKCDITDVAEVADFSRAVVRNGVGGIDACVHLAAVAAPREAAANPSLAWETNVRGTHNVLGLCCSLRVPKVVFASSAHVYGISPKYMPTDEQHPLSLLDTYTVTKILGEELCALYNRNYGLSTTVLRLFNAYGPGQSADYFIGKKIAEAKAGRIQLMNASVTKDWVWAADVADAMVRAMRTSYVGPLNIGTGFETSLREIADCIAVAFGAEVVEDPATDDSPTRMCCDAGRAEKVLGWRPMVDFATGLSMLIESSKG